VAVEQLVAPWLEQSRNLADALRKLTVRFDCPQIGLFIANAAGESEVALAVALEDARTAIERVRSGAEPIPATEQPAPVVELLPPPATKRVFLLRHVKWTDASGALQIGGRYNDVDLTPAAAARALKIGAGTELDDPRRKIHHGTWGAGQPNPANCEALDDEAAASAGPATPSAVEPIRHSQFEVMDRGPAFTMRVPREVAS
jgi:hypothetical protein